VPLVDGQRGTHAACELAVDVLRDVLEQVGRHDPLVPPMLSLVHHVPPSCRHDGGLS
jgi:hypothetical protein